MHLHVFCGNHEDAMFAHIFGKVCDRIEHQTEIFEVITVLQMSIVLQRTTEIQCEGSSGMV